MTSLTTQRQDYIIKDRDPKKTIFLRFTVGTHFVGLAGLSAIDWKFRTKSSCHAIASAVQFSPVQSLLVQHATIPSQLLGVSVMLDQLSKVDYSSQGREYCFRTVLWDERAVRIENLPFTFQAFKDFGFPGKPHFRRELGPP